MIENPNLDQIFCIPLIQSWKKVLEHLRVINGKVSPPLPPYNVDQGQWLLQLARVSQH